MTPTPKATDLQALLERVEAASGPDRELDIRIARCFGWTEYDDGVGYMTRWRDPDGVIGAGRPPLFTASFDAALALAERVRGEDEANLLLGMARRWAHARHFDGGLVSCLARGMVAAILKAMIATQGEKT